MMMAPNSASPLNPVNTKGSTDTIAARAAYRIPGVAPFTVRLKSPARHDFSPVVSSSRSFGVDGNRVSAREGAYSRKGVISIGQCPILYGATVKLKVSRI